MRIAVLSDLHLGAFDKADRGRGHDEHLLAVLSALEAEHDQIILLGDVWETLTCRFSKGLRGCIKGRSRRPPRRCTPIHTAKYRLVSGNHDWITASASGAAQEIMVDSNGLVIRFMHGHQHDPWSGSLRFISEFIIWFSGWMARLGTDVLIRFFDRLHNLLSKTSVADELGPSEAKLLADGADRQVDVTVIGHTHVPGIKTDQGQLLVNSGHCLGGVVHSASLDTDARTIRVVRFTQDGVNMCETVLATQTRLSKHRRAPLPTPCVPALSNVPGR